MKRTKGMCMRRFAITVVSAIALSGCKTPRDARLEAMQPQERTAYLAWEAERNACRSVVEKLIPEDGSRQPAPSISFSSGAIITPNGPIIYQQNTVTTQGGGGFAGGFAAGMAQATDRLNLVDGWTSKCMMDRGWIDGSRSGWKQGRITR